MESRPRIIWRCVAIVSAIILLLLFGWKAGTMNIQGRPEVPGITESEAVVWRSVDAWNAHDLKTLSGLLHENVVLRRADDPPLDGRTAYLAADEAFLRAFPDAHSVVQSVIARGDKVVLEFRIQGTHRGVFKGIEPTGRRIDIPIVEILTFRQGKIVEVHRYLDPTTYDRLLKK